MFLLRFQKQALNELFPTAEVTFLGEPVIVATSVRLSENVIIWTNLNFL